MGFWRNFSRTIMKFFLYKEPLFLRFFELDLPSLFQVMS